MNALLATKTNDYEVWASNAADSSPFEGAVKERQIVFTPRKSRAESTEPPAQPPPRWVAADDLLNCPENLTQNSLFTDE
jgi:hypothetical protein